MDLLDLASKKILSLPAHLQDGWKAALHHVEAAEEHYKRGIEEGNDEFFNDVIYRSNQAFEGALKEAYAQFSERDPYGSKTYEIEKYLLEEELLNKRVVDLFSNYRKDWRNPSAHDHRLVFSRNEALLALVFVNAFFSVLLDQVLEDQSYDSQLSLIHEAEDDFSGKVLKGESLIEDVASVLQVFAAEQERIEDVTPSAVFPILLGRAVAYVASAIPGASVQKEPYVDYRDSFVQPDFVVWNDSEQVVVELKVSRPLATGLSRDEQILMTYVDATQSGGGILVYLAGKGQIYRQIEKNADGNIRLFFITPNG